MDRDQERNQRGQGLINFLSNAQFAAKAATKAPLLLNPWVLGAVIIIIIIIVFIIVFSGQGGGKPPGPGDEKDKIPGLSLALDGPLETDNNTEVRYTLRVSFDQAKSPIPLSSITVFDNLPSDTEFVSATGEYVYNPSLKLISWALKAIENQNGFSLIIKPSRTDFRFSNKMYATATPVSPSGEGGSGNECTIPYEGSEYCSVENLKQPFGDGTKALIASLVCQAESGSDPFVINDNCRTNDYSVGLFQINLVAHCVGAYAGQSCERLINRQKRKDCEQTWLKANENITKATEVSEAGTKWNKWGTWLSSNKNSPAVKETLDKCDIQY